MILSARTAGDDAALLIESGASTPWAVVLEERLVSEGPPPLEAIASAVQRTRAPRLALWSGAPTPGLFDRNPASWSAEAHNQLDRGVMSARAGLADLGCRLLLRPHARHTLSDAIAVRAFLDRHDGAVGLFLDVVSMLEPGMLPRAADHVDRSLSALGGAADAILLAAPVVDDRWDDPIVAPVPFGSSGADDRLPRDLLEDLVEAHTPSETPRVRLLEPDES